MSGIYIPMEMPKEGTIFVIDSAGQVWSKEWPTRGYTRLDGVRAIPVPDHGRLIDADALGEMLEKYKKEYALKAKEDIVHLHKAWGLNEAELMAESLPTIIPASGGTENVDS